MRNFPAIAIACMIGTASQADVNVTFFEGAPKDKFVLTNVGSCELESVNLTLDLTGSDSGLIFDVTDSGQGVEVFQPFQFVSGQDLVADTPNVGDGDKTVTLSMDRFGIGQSIAFTIDLDDTSGGREITVSDSEMSGATVSVATAKGTFSGVFGGNSEARVLVPDCAA